MTKNKLADTFLLDLENLSDDSGDDVKKVPEKQEIKDTKLDYFGKKQKISNLPAVVSNASAKILDSASTNLINNPDYINFKNSLINDEKQNFIIIPSTLTKEDKM